MIRLILLAILSILLAVAGWFSLQAYHVYVAIRKTTNVQVPRTKQEPKVTIPPLDSNQRINFLILGSDNDLKKEEARPLTQSMIVVTVDPKHDKVSMLSIPRDFWVPIRGHGMAKIDLANKYGGIALARETVENLFHIPIDYYAWVGLNGFIRVADTFGGVTLDVTHPILDDTYPNDLSGHDPYAYRRIFIPPGWQHMSGSQALEYVRSRHGDRIGDFGRSARQQQVLLSLRRKINTMSILTHLPQLVSDLSDSVRTDLSITKLYQLEQLSHHITRQDVTQVVLQAPTYSSYDWRDGQSVVLPNWSRIGPLVRQMFAPISSANASRPAPPIARAGPVPTAKPNPTPAPTAIPSAKATASPIATRSGAKGAPTAPGRAPRARHPQGTPPPSRLPGTLVFVRGGNMFELMPDQSLKQIFWGGDGSMPSPSPDGRTIAFVRFTTGLHRFDKYASDIWLLDLATGRQHVLTHNESAQASNNLWSVWPSWSPDGTQLLFSWDAVKLSQPIGDARPVDLAVYSTPVRGMQPVQLTTPAQGAGGDTEPSWRPGRRQFLYVRWDYLGSSNQPYSQLVIKDPSSGTSWQLTSVGGRVLQPQWDRQGSRLTFVQEANGTDQIVVAGVVDTRNGPRLGRETVLATGQVGQPAFSPDGRWVSWLHSNGDDFALAMAPAGGGKPIELGAAGTGIDARSRPVWMR